MFSVLRTTFKPQKFTRLYSSVAENAGSKKGSSLMWASLATGALIAGGYYYSNLKANSNETEAKVEPALDPNKFVGFKLADVTKINHDTSQFRFSLQPNQNIGLKVSSCLVVKANIGNDEKPTIRPYTPASPDDVVGYFDLIVKDYPNGKMSSYIHSLKPGDVLEMKGPIPKYPYEVNKLKEIGMIAGGSGITPMLQVIEHVLKRKDDKTKLVLVFANKSEEDIILKDKLDEFEKKNPDRFKVNYIIDKPTTKDWNGDVGFVTKDIVTKYMPKASDSDVLVTVCGPPPMVDSISGPKAPDYSQGELSGILKDLGYKKEQVFKF